MNNRRSLVQAFDMTPQKIAFITSGPPETQAAAPKSSTSPKPSNRDGQQEPITTSESETVPTEQSEPHKKFRPARERGAQSKWPETMPLTTPVVSITTRLKQPTAEALRRASLERKLAGVAPSSQQEIVELAVREWLKDNDFIR